MAASATDANEKNESCIPTYSANWTAGMQRKGSEGAFMINKSSNDKIVQTKNKEEN